MPMKDDLDQKRAFAYGRFHVELECGVEVRWFSGSIGARNLGKRASPGSESSERWRRRPWLPESKKKTIVSQLAILGGFQRREEWR